MIPRDLFSVSVVLFLDTPEGVAQELVSAGLIDGSDMILGTVGATRI